MKSKAVESFWEGFDRLPEGIQDRAKKQYSLWLRNPNHPSLRFKKVGDYWSARVTGAYRVVGIMDGDTVSGFSLALTLSTIGYSKTKFNKCRHRTFDDRVWFFERCTWGVVSSIIRKILSLVCCARSA